MSKRRIVIALSALIILAPAVVWGINTVATGFKVANITTQIDAHNICKDVTATDGKTYFVPTKTLLEWTTFLSKKPPTVTAVNCASTGTCSIDSQVAINLWPTACAIKNDQSLSCWDWSTGATAASGLPAGQYKAVKFATDATICALQTNGNLVCAGGQFGRTNMPTTGTYKNLDVSIVHFCAIKSDDTVKCWGEYHGIIAGSWGNAVSPSGTYKSISTSNSFGCGIKTNGVIDCWGANAVPTAAELAPLQNQNLVTIKTVGTAVCGLTQAGNIKCNKSFFNAPLTSYTGPATFKYIDGVCGLQQNGKILCPGATTFIPTSTFTAIGGSGLYCGIQTTGSVQCWTPNPNYESAGWPKPPSQNNSGFGC